MTTPSASRDRSSNRLYVSPGRRSAFLVAALVAAGLAGQPRHAAAQWVVWDPGNFAQAVTDQITRVAQYALQGLEYAEAVQGVLHLAQQIEQLDSTYAHQKEAAMGRIGQLADLFSAMAEADASTLLDADFGSWKNRIGSGAGAIADELAGLSGGSLSDFLVDDMAAAADIDAGLLRGLFPNNAPSLGDSMAVRFERGRERGDRIRAGDMATAEAAGRVAELLEAVQGDIDARKGQAELSHTALQQAQLASQLTAGEMQVALAQLDVIRAQQAALARHEAEILARDRLVRWVAAERAAQARAEAQRAAEEARRSDWRAARVGRLAIR